MEQARQVVERALALFHAGQAEAAAGTLAAFLGRYPTEPNANKLLAMIYGAHGQDEDALRHVELAIRGDAGDASLRSMQGNLLMLLSRRDEAEHAYARAVALAPNDPAMYDGLAKCLLVRGEVDRAAGEYERGLGAVPTSEFLFGQYGQALVQAGRTGQAVDVLRRGVRACPASDALWQFLAYAINFADDATPEEVAAAHRRAGGALGVGVEAGMFPNSREPERRLRVGVVSTDFHQHSCAFFLEPLLEKLDRSRVEVFLYATGPGRDEVTARFRALGAWREVPQAAGLGEACRADAIDVAIDATGWTHRPTLEAFARRVAPVQVTYLGYPNTTGVGAMDARIVDHFTDPPGAEAWCTERLVRLSGCFVCFRPPADAPEPAPTPFMLGQAPAPTFGSFNRVTKASDTTIKLWAGVLRAVPGSTLLIKSKTTLDDAADHQSARLAALGVDPARVRLAPFAPSTRDHLAMYHQVDVALDSYPYHGTTTTCEALWMGVPVVVLAGRAHHARVGVSLLEAAGCGAMSCDALNTPDAFVAKAAALALDRAGLTRLRAELRGRVQAGPLRDEVGHARRFEAALRDLWRAFVAGPKG